MKMTSKQKIQRLKIIRQLHRVQRARKDNAASRMVELDQESKRIVKSFPVLERELYAEKLARYEI